MLLNQIMGKIYVYIDNVYDLFYETNFFIYTNELQNIYNKFNL